MSHAKPSFSTEICAGAMISVVQYLALLRCIRISGAISLSLPKYLHGMQGTICFESIQDRDRPHGAPPQVVCKPQAEAFERAMRHAGFSEPSETLFVDDSPSNIAAAHRLGMLTVLVGCSGPHVGADYVIGNFRELTQVLPQLCGCRPSFMNQSLNAEELPTQPEGIPALA
jgi:beta-phosphoglucomutase-like phosphatase (HAD superfamily)